MRRLLGALLLVTACSKLTSPGAPKPVGPYPDGAAGLRALFADVLTAAKKDDRSRVHDLLASTILTDAELGKILGPEAVPQLRPRYDALMETMVNRGAVELVANVYERKYNDVEVFPLSGTSTEVNDQAILRALKQPLPLYSVRIKKAGETRGIRYDFFLYLDGRWKTGNQLGKFLGELKHGKDAGT